MFEFLFSFAIAQQVAGFTLRNPERGMAEKIMKGFGKQTIVLASGPTLKVYSMTGENLHTFQDHQFRITSIWVVKRILTTTPATFSSVL